MSLPTAASMPSVFEPNKTIGDMPTERENLIQDMNVLKERLSLAWVDMVSKPMTPAERQELRKSIDSLIADLDKLRTKLDQSESPGLG
jgi:hypothetical protein